MATLKTLSPSGARSRPPGRWAGARGAAPASTTEVGGRLRENPARFGTAGYAEASSPGRPAEGGSEVAPPLPDSRRAPSVTPRAPAAVEGRAGPPRCAGDWAEAGRCAAPPRAGPPGLPPRESESVAPEEVGHRGAGPPRTREPARGTGGAMDGLGRRLRASLRLKRGRGG